MTASTIAPPTTQSTTTIAFTVEAGALATATEQVARRIPRRPAIPTLACLLLEVADGRLTVSAFDYDVAASAQVDVVGDTAGRALVSGRLLAELVKTFPDRPVTARVDGTRLAVTCGSVKVKLPLMPAEDYPALPDTPPTIGVVDTEALAAAVTRVYPATDPTVANGVPMLAGIHLRIAGDRISVEGSDRYRAAIADLAWTPADPNIDTVALVPATVVYETAKTFGAAGGPVTVGLVTTEGGGLIGLTHPAGSVVARLLADKYPNLPSLFPPHVDQPTTLPVAALTAALKRAQIVHEAKTPVRLAFTAEQVELTAADGDTALGDAVDCQHHGEPVTVGVNPDYLLDALTCLRADAAELHIAAPSRPLLLTVPDDHTYRHVIMPIRNPKGSQ
jgi:DNA polymerase-3 subunit beta